METLVGVLLATTPITLTLALLSLAGRRQRAREAGIARQIALTDALHARLGAVVAPVVRRRRHGWDVSIAVPVERPDVTAVVLATVDAAFDGARYELRLRRQTPFVAARNVRRAAPAAQESLSWT